MGPRFGSQKICLDPQHRWDGEHLLDETKGDVEEARAGGHVQPVVGQRDNPVPRLACNTSS